MNIVSSYVMIVARMGERKEKHCLFYSFYSLLSLRFLCLLRSLSVSMCVCVSLTVILFLSLYSCSFYFLCLVLSMCVWAFCLIAVLYFFFFLYCARVTRIFSSNEWRRKEKILIQQKHWRKCPIQLAHRERRGKSVDVGMSEWVVCKETRLGAKENERNITTQ